MNIKKVGLIILGLVLGTLVGLSLGTVLVVFSLTLLPIENPSMTIVIYYVLFIAIGALLGISFGIFYYR